MDCGLFQLCGDRARWGQSILRRFPVAPLGILYVLGPDWNVEACAILKSYVFYQASWKV